jgi:hypothetical protein
MSRAWIEKRLRLGSEVVGTYARTRWLLRRTDLPAALRALRSRPRKPREDREPHDEALALARAAYRAMSALPADTRCLTRSLVVASMLERRGIEAKVVLAAHNRGGFAAHAWVEVEGRALVGDAGEPYQRLAEL